MKSNVEKLEEIVKPMVDKLNQIEVESESVPYPRRTFTCLREVDFSDNGTYGLFFYTDELRKFDSDYNDDTMEWDLKRRLKKMLSEGTKEFEFARDEGCEKGSWGFYVKPTVENKDFRNLDKATNEI